MGTSRIGPRRAFTVLALVGLLGLPACSKPASTSSSTSTTDTAAGTPSAAPASAPSPMAGIAPHVDAAPASAAAGTGPAEAATAIGGVVGNQDAGGARKGGTPAPTGGDAASSPAK